MINKYNDKQKSSATPLKQRDNTIADKSPGIQFTKKWLTVTSHKLNIKIDSKVINKEQIN